jgi:hypothetical protein
MRLLLVCLAIFLAPAGALLLSVQRVDAIEAEFAADRTSHVTRLDRITALYPPNLLRMRNVAAILQLKQMAGGSTVAANVCAVPDSPYQRLFERLPSRCASWGMYRRARSAALFGAIAAIGAFALILIARIKVRRYQDRQEPPGNWAHVFILRGIPVLLIGHIVIALLGYGVVLQTMTGKAWYAAGILTIPFLALFLLQRRLVTDFVEPQALGGYGSRRRKGRARRSLMVRDTPPEN